MPEPDSLRFSARFHPPNDRAAFAPGAIPTGVEGVLTWPGGAATAEVVDVQPAGDALEVTMETTDPGALAHLRSAMLEPQLSLPDGTPAIAWDVAARDGLLADGRVIARSPLPSSEWYAEFLRHLDRLLIGIDDNGELAVDDLQAVPPGWAAVLARIAERAGVRLERGTAEQVTAEAARVGGSGALGAWWKTSLDV